MTSIYDGQFRGNVLAVGKTGCGKTTFLQKLGINNFFGDIVKTEWISGIDIDEKRKAKIQSCFSNETEVHTAKEPDELDLLIETFKLRHVLLIVMDNVSGVADISKKFAKF